MSREEIGQNQSSTSAISLQAFQERLESADAPEPEAEPEMQELSRRINSKKRKRASFASPKKGKEEKDVFNLLSKVPQITEHFNIGDKIGEGTFSSVYHATLRMNLESSKEFALKHIIPTSHPDRILSELSCLLRIGGVDNVMGVDLTVREKDNIVIVMPYFKHFRFQDFYHDMSVEEVREYMRNLFVALRRVHKFNIIHRDVKPGNFLYDREKKRYALVDFGLAQAVPGLSRPKQTTKGTTVGGVLHHDTPKLSQTKKNVRRSQALAENKKEPALDAKRTRPESRTSAPRLVELDPNTFDHSNEKSSRERSHSHHSDDLKKNVNPVIPLDVENIPEDVISQKVTDNLKPVVLTRKCAAAVVKKEKKVQKEPPSGETVSTCGCFGLPQVCDVCMSWKNQVAPRAGTPGFRSPEVLLKCPDQTTAVDMWAGGVILLSILSGRYPFFRAQDDLTALAQIMSIMGTEETKAAAELNGKNLQCSVKLPTMDLKVLCRQLRLGAMQSREKKKSRRRSHGESSKRRRRSNGLSPPSLENQANGHTDNKDFSKSPNSENGAGSEKNDTGDQFPDSAYDLLCCLLELNPKKRISASEALRHPFIMGTL